LNAPVILVDPVTFTLLPPYLELERSRNSVVKALEAD